MKNERSDKGIITLSGEIGKDQINHTAGTAARLPAKYKIFGVGLVRSDFYVLFLDDQL